MAGALMLARQVVQPQGRAEIDWSNPLARGLRAFVVVMDGVPIEVVSNTRLSAVGAAKVMAGKDTGFGAYANTTTDCYSADIPEIDLSAAPGATWFGLGYSTVSNTTAKRLGMFTTSASANVAALSFGDGANNFYFAQRGGTSNNTSWFAAAPSAYKSYFLSFSVPTSSATGTIYIYGVPRTTTLSGSGTGWSGKITKVLLAGNAVAAPFKGVVSIFGLYDRMLTAGEHRALYENPWQLLRPAQRRMWLVPAPAGGSPTTVSPSKGALTLTGYAPAVGQTVTITVAPTKGALALTGYAPTVLRSVSVSPGKGALALTGYAPTITQSANQTVAPQTGHLRFTGYEPSVSNGSVPAISPDNFLFRKRRLRRAS